jgi:hypothetical protein
LTVVVTLDSGNLLFFEPKRPFYYSYILFFSQLFRTGFAMCLLPRSLARPNLSFPSSDLRDYVHSNMDAVRSVDHVGLAKAFITLPEWPCTSTIWPTDRLHHGLATCKVTRTHGETMTAIKPSSFVTITRPSFSRQGFLNLQRFISQLAIVTVRTTGSTPRST